MPRTVLELVMDVVVLQDDDSRVSSADKRRIPERASAYPCPIFDQQYRAQPWSMSLYIPDVLL